MPITSIVEPSRWGYMPIFYFASEERFGGAKGFRALVQACHESGIAVILDMVYAHADFMFPYQVGYDPFFDLWKQHQYEDAGTLHRSPNPMSSAYSNFGHKNDFRMKSVQEFFAAVNQFWLDEYHVDGFRYDHVNGYLDKAPSENSDGSVSWYSRENRPNFVSLQNLSNATYNHSKSITRFQNIDGSSRIIQIAEDLGESAYQLGTSNYGLPSSGYGRVRGARPLHWDYFYSPKSSVEGGTVLPLTRLYRILGDIRQARPAGKSDRHHCFLEVEHLGRKIIVYRRWQEADVVLVAINFSEKDQNINIPFGQVGIWTDILKLVQGWQKFCRSYESPHQAARGVLS